jgi:hypothetical protein
MLKLLEKVLEVSRLLRLNNEWGSAILLKWPDIGYNLLQE